MPFKDHFSGHAADYALARPAYPAALFDWLAAQAPGRTLAWDVATGNGQAAAGLAAHFEAVFATDASAQQIDQASAPGNVRFGVEAAEQCSLTDGSADLVSVAQALHWFDHARFYPEVHRVLRPGGLFAAWTYRLSTVSPAIDAVVWRLYEGIVGPWWPPERCHVDAGYADLPFPFREVPDPQIRMQTTHTLAQYLAYLRTWSAVRRYQAARGEDPVAVVGLSIRRSWQRQGKGGRFPAITKNWAILRKSPAGEAGLSRGRCNQFQETVDEP